MAAPSDLWFRGVGGRICAIARWEELRHRARAYRGGSLFSEGAIMRFNLSLVAACAVGFTLSASAHHSHGQYAETFQDIEGVVKELHLLTPHSWLYIDVKDQSGAVQVWALEATTRGSLEKMGVTRDYVKAGDRVKARCHPLRDKTNGCLLGFLKAPDGSVKDWDGGNAPAPKDF